MGGCWVQCWLEGWVTGCAAPQVMGTDSLPELVMETGWPWAVVVSMSGSCPAVVMVTG